MALTQQQLEQFMAAAQAEQREQVLYSFNAGTMTMSGKTVTADPRKGKVVLSMEDDGLLRFQWRLRHAQENEQQFFIFPQGAAWTKVEECKDGKVFLLKFNDSNQKCFFWLQEPISQADKKEKEVLRKVQSLIAHPPKFGAPLPKDEDEEDSASAEAAAEEAKQADVRMDHVSSVAAEAGDAVVVQGRDHSHPPVSMAEHRGAALSPAAGAAAGAAGAASGAGETPSAAAPSSSSAASTGTGGLDAASLMNTLNAMAQQLAARQQQSASAGVEDVLEPSRVQPILDVDRALVDALVQYLPEGQRDASSLRATLRSPQLQQTMTRLTQLLNSAQFGQMMASLALPPGEGMGVDGFLRAIQEQADKQKQQQGDKPKEQ